MQYVLHAQQISGKSKYEVANTSQRQMAKHLGEKINERHIKHSDLEL